MSVNVQTDRRNYRQQQNFRIRIISFLKKNVYFLNMKKKEKQYVTDMHQQAFSQSHDIRTHLYTDTKVTELDFTTCVHQHIRGLHIFTNNYLPQVFYVKTKHKNMNDSLHVIFSQQERSSNKS